MLQQFALRLGLGQPLHVLFEPHPEGLCAVEIHGALVEGEPHTGPDQRLGPQSACQHQTGVHEFLELAGLRREGDRELLLEHPDRELLLGAEMEVQRALGDARPVQDLPDGRRGVAAFVEDGRGRLQDGPPGADRALLSRHRVPPDLRRSL